MRDELFKIGSLPTPNRIMLRMAMLPSSVAVACAPEGISVFNSTMKTLDRLDEYTYAGLDIPELYHSGWSNVSDINEVVVRRGTAVGKTTYIPPFLLKPINKSAFKTSEDRYRESVESIAHYVGLSTEQIRAEIKNVLSEPLRGHSSISEAIYGGVNTCRDHYELELKNYANEHTENSSMLRVLRWRGSSFDAVFAMKNSLVKFKLFPIKEAPHYRTLEFGKKKKRF